LNSSGNNLYKAGTAQLSASPMVKKAFKMQAVC